MPPRRRKAPAARPAPKLGVGGLLDWSASSHFAYDSRPCRYCGHPTHLRDEMGAPADKVCAEAAYAEVIQVAMAQHRQGRL